MPRYDYKCPECGKIEEHIHSFNETPVYKCEDDNRIMKKIIGSVNINCKFMNDD